MKRLTPIVTKAACAVLAVLLCSSVFAQQGTNVKAASAGNMAGKAPNPPVAEQVAVAGGSQAQGLQVNPTPVSAAGAAASSEFIIGTTTYDLQSNSSVQNRLVNKNGTLSAAWIYSSSSTVAAPDRGTGYNYHNGVSWGPAPSARLETQRTGWPSMVASPLVGELAVSHSVNEEVYVTSRPTVGTGTWSETALAGPGMFWPRTVQGGTNGTTLHSIALSTPVANGGALFLGQDGALTYSRSLDGGANWDIQNFVPAAHDQTSFSGFTADNYHLAEPVGNTVAYGVFNTWGDSFIMKSVDNGTTWTKIIFLDSPLDLYDPTASGTLSDTSGNGIADTLYTTDNTGWVLLDDNGMAHVFYGRMRVMDDDPTTGAGWSLFPATNGLMYWNEGFGSRPPVLLTAAPDIDGNGTVDVIGGTISGIADYDMSLSSQPSAGIDANGCIYVSYAAHMENLHQSTQNYRHIWVMRSCDGGCSWSQPLDATSVHVFQECVFPAMARNVDTDVHILYQQDTEPGLAVQGDQDPFSTNNIVHLKVPVTDFIAQPDTICLAWIEGDNSFCTGDSVLLSATCGNSYQWKFNGVTIAGATNATHYASQYGVYSVDIGTNCGTITSELTTFAPTSAPTIQVSATDAEICPGDFSTLTATVLSGGSSSYLWSTGNTLPTIVVSTAGTYNVSVTNCGGTATGQFTVSLPNAPNASISGLTEVCTGDSIMLNALAQPSATYLWSTGSTAQATYANAAGTYSVTVSNCAGSAVDNYAVTTTPLPVPNISAIGGGTSTCEGGQGVTLAASGADSYLWSSGETSNFIVLDSASQSGSYTVDGSNACGDVVTSNSILVTITEPMIGSVIAQATTCAQPNGEVTVAMSQGGGPFSYVWSNGQTTQTATGLAPGSYSVTVNDNMNVCPAVTYSGSVASSTGPALIATFEGDVTCIGASDGSASVAVSGGTPAYTYAWPDGTASPNGMGLAAGAYVVSVTDADNCTDTVTVTIGEPAPIIATVSSVDADCGNNNGAATVFASGGASGFAYLWSNGQTTSTASALGPGTYDVTVTDQDGCTATGQAQVSNSGGGSASINLSNDPQCAGGCDGAATVTATGGTPPLTYLWSDPNGQTNLTATGLCAGNFSVSVTDSAGCIAIASVTLTEPQALVIAVTEVDESCGNANGVASAAVSGGLPNYTYAWSNGQTSSITTGLSAGIYVVTVTDANGCSDTSSASIVDDNTLTSNAAGVDPSCGNTDGAATVAAAGGQPPYTYLWSTGDTGSGITNIPAGLYGVTVTDAAGCETVQQVALSDAGAGTPNSSENDASCFGAADGSAAITMQGGTSPFTYSWSNGAASSILTGLTAGGYSCTITDANGCTAIVDVEIDEPAGMALTTLANDATVTPCDGSAAVTPSGGGGAPYTFAWDDANASTTSIVTGLCPGTYHVTVTDAAGCSQVDTAVVGGNIGIADVLPELQMQLFPNPAGDWVMLQRSEPGKTLDWTLVAMDGRHVQAGQLRAEQRSARLDLAGMAAGVYMLRLRTADGVAVKRLVHE